MTLENKKRNIILIGPMGAGKSTVGMRLAKLLGKRFFDSDYEIQNRTGVTISWIFEVELEEGFRKREERMIAELSEIDNIVLSTGGGAIVSEENRKLLAHSGIVIYLKVPLEEQLSRITKRTTTTHRPMLDVPDPRARLIELNEQRAPLYEQIADISIESTRQDVSTLVSKIFREIQKLVNEK